MKVDINKRSFETVEEALRSDAGIQASKLADIARPDIWGRCFNRNDYNELKKQYKDFIKAYKEYTKFVQKTEYFIEGKDD